jgi:hypothetical protein
MVMASAKTTTKKSAPSFRSRAVMRTIEAGSSAECAHCGERVKFQAKIRGQQVICNVYVDGKWDRVEHFHAECYTTHGEPYGKAAA